MSAVRTLRAATDRPMPDGAGARLDQARETLIALRDEERRLECLGFERPLQCCRESVRYWSFVAGLLSLPGAVACDPQGGPRWRGAGR